VLSSLEGWPRCDPSRFETRTLEDDMQNADHDARTVATSGAAFRGLKALPAPVAVAPSR
jgi:hypothetical protein